MLLPIGPVNNVPVRLVSTPGDTPVIVEGEIVHFDGRMYRIKTADGRPSMRVDDQLILHFDDPSTSSRLVCLVATDKETVSVVTIGRARRPERREFPRIEGRIALEFSLLGNQEHARLEHWLQRPHLELVGEVWYVPDPFMEFSVTGLKFYTNRPPEIGQLLRLRMSFPGFNPTPFYAGGEVVRVDVEEDGYTAVATAFTGIPQELTDTLLSYTRYCQEILLGLTPSNG